MTSMSCKLELTISSHDTDQQIPYFDRCQLIITWMSDIKEVHGKPRLHVSVNLLLEYGRHVARLHRRPGGVGSPSHNALRINYIINRRWSRDLLVVSGVHGVEFTVS